MAFGVCDIYSFSRLKNLIMIVSVRKNKGYSGLRVVKGAVVSLLMGILSFAYQQVAFSFAHLACQLCNQGMFDHIWTFLFRTKDSISKVSGSNHLEK